MQKRHTDRALYFKELATTSEKYLVPFIEKKQSVTTGMKVLEIGCGDGGNLVPFVRKGCHVTGIDLDETRIQQAINFMNEYNCPAKLFVADILTDNRFDHDYDLILVHDVIEHIYNKEALFIRIKELLKPSGMAYFGFPAWQMPFGGHQQICPGRLTSHLPFIHLLPASGYRFVLYCLGEKEGTIEGMLEIKSCGTTVEQFKKLAKRYQFDILEEQLYFINPHYETKFGLKPRQLHPSIAKVPFVRNFFSTSCFYLISPRKEPGR